MKAVYDCVSRAKRGYGRWRAKFLRAQRRNAMAEGWTKVQIKNFMSGSRAGVKCVVGHPPKDFRPRFLHRPR